MKIVVLGNGFDRANGLPTAYSQFFKYIEKKNINLSLHNIKTIEVFDSH